MRGAWQGHERGGLGGPQDGGDAVGPWGLVAAPSAPRSAPAACLSWPGCAEPSVLEAAGGLHDPHARHAAHHTRPQPGVCEPRQQPARCEEGLAGAQCAGGDRLPGPEWVHPELKGGRSLPVPDGALLHCTTTSLLECRQAPPPCSHLRGCHTRIHPAVTWKAAIHTVILQ